MAKLYCKILLELVLCNLSVSCFAQYYSDKSKVLVGDYVYEDGSFSHSRLSSKKCLGVIISKIVDKNDKAHGWKYGVVMSLHDCGDGDLYAWGPTNSKIYNDTLEYRYEICDTLGEQYQAFHAVKNIPRPNFPNSGWQVPSPSHWESLVKNVGIDNMEKKLNFQRENLWLSNGYWLCKSSSGSTAFLGIETNANNGMFWGNSGNNRNNFSGIRGFMGDKQKKKKVRAVFVF